MKNKIFVKRLFASILAVSLLKCSAVSVSAYDLEPIEPIPDNETLKSESITWSNSDSDELVSSDSFFYSENDNGTIMITGYNGKETDVVIPSKIEGKSVTVIGAWAFEKCKSIISVYIPRGVKKIQAGAFYQCTSLENISISESVDTIVEEFTFQGCNSLRTISVSEDNMFFISINGVLYNKEQTKLIKCPCKYSDNSFVCPESVTSIGDEAFVNCKAIKTMVFPKGLTDVRAWAFKGTSWYNDQPYGIVYAGSIACGYKQGETVEEIVRIKDGTKLLDLNIEYTGIKQLILPDGIESVKGSGRWSALQSINIPDSVTEYNFDLTDTPLIANQADGVIYIDKIAYCYKGDEIPQVISINEGTKIVTLDWFVGSDGYTGTRMGVSCQKLQIPSSVVKVDIIPWDNLQAIEVDEANRYYCTENNILYNKLKTELVFFPPNTNSFYCMPNSVEKISRYAFYQDNYYNDIYFSENIRELNYPINTYGRVFLPHGIRKISYDALEKVSMIFGYVNTESENYARENGIDFVDMNCFAADYGKYTVSYAEDKDSQPFYFFPPEDGVYVFKLYSDNAYTVYYPKESAWSESENGFVDVCQLNKDQLYDFQIRNATSDVTIEVLSVDDVAAKDFGVYNQQKDTNKFVFKAKEKGLYVFELKSEDAFQVTSYLLTDVVVPVGSLYSCKYHVHAAELEKDDIFVFTLWDCSSDVKISVVDSVSGVLYCPVAEGETALEYSFSNYHLTLSRIGGLSSLVGLYHSDLTDISEYVKHVTLNEGISEIGNGTFYDFYSLETVFIPDTVTYIDEHAFTCPRSDQDLLPIDNLTIYGYSGSYAETYANEMGFAFVAVEKIKDKTSGIEVKGKLDSKTKLKINELSVEEIELDEESRQVKVGFDISLLKGKKEVQPEIPVTVKIPYSGATSNIEVYRLNEDGTKDKMIFTFDGSYISFVTDHFSKYIVVGDASVLGDTNGDGIADIADSLMISRYDAGLITLDDSKVAVSDVNNDGSADIADALKIARYDAGLIESLS